MTHHIIIFINHFKLFRPWNSNVPFAAVTTAISTACNSSARIAAMPGAAIAAPPARIREAMRAAVLRAARFFQSVPLRFSPYLIIFVIDKAKYRDVCFDLSYRNRQFHNNSQTEQMVLSYPARTVFSIWVVGAWRCPVTDRGRTCRCLFE